MKQYVIDIDMEAGQPLYPVPIKEFNIQIKTIGPDYVQFITLLIFEEDWVCISSGFNPITSIEEYQKWSRYPPAPPGILDACKAWGKTEFKQSMTLADFLRKMGFDACLSN